MTLVLTTDTIRMLATTPGVVAGFPFLAPFARPTTPACCGSVPQGPNPQHAIAAILGLTLERKIAFKAAVNADTVTGRVVRAGKSVTLEF